MIQHKTIDGLLLRDMVVAGAALLEKNREAVDALTFSLSRTAIRGRICP